MWPLWERAESHHCLVPSTVPEPGCLRKSGADKPIKEQLGGETPQSVPEEKPPQPPAQNMKPNNRSPPRSMSCKTFERDREARTVTNLEHTQTMGSRGI